jgi:hypothetical protein
MNPFDFMDMISLQGKTNFSHACYSATSNVTRTPTPLNTFLAALPVTLTSPPAACPGPLGDRPMAHCPVLTAVMNQPA